MNPTAHTDGRTDLKEHMKHMKTTAGEHQETIRDAFSCYANLLKLLDERFGEKKPRHRLSSSLYLCLSRLPVLQ